VAGRAPLRQTDAIFLIPSVLGMKYDLGATHRRPAHRLGIAPALMADRHAKLHPINLKDSPVISGHIELIFTRVDLILGLVSLYPPASVNDIGGNLPPRLREPFYPKNRCHRIRSRPLRHDLERPLLLRLIKREHFKILAPQTREIGFRETDDLGALSGRLG